MGEGQVNHFTRGDGQETGTGTFLDNLIVSSSLNQLQFLVLLDFCFLRGTRFYLIIFFLFDSVVAS